MPELELSYRRGESFFHRMSPVAKLLWVMAVSFVAIFNQSFAVGVGLVAFTVVCAAFTGVGIRAYWTFGKVILPFIAILAVVFPFFYGGQVTAGGDEVAISTPIKDLTWGALGFGGLLALRFLAIGIAGLTFAFTTHPSDLVHNLSRRGLDYRFVHAPVLGLVMFPSLLQLGRDISTTQRIRDLGKDMNPVKRKWIRMKHLAFAMLVLGLRRGQTQAMALDIRGYGAHKQRTFLRPLPQSRAGTAFGVACLVLGIVYLVAQFGALGGAMPWDIE
jgi:energy-coupling factor transport system permease protein